MGIPNDRKMCNKQPVQNMSNKEILERNPYPEEDMLEILDRAFISKNLSPGGSADLLAFTYFLYFLKEQ